MCRRLRRHVRRRLLHRGRDRRNLRNGLRTGGAEGVSELLDRHRRHRQRRSGRRPLPGAGRRRGSRRHLDGVGEHLREHRLEPVHPLLRSLRTPGRRGGRQQLGGPHRRQPGQRHLPHEVGTTHTNDEVWTGTTPFGSYEGSSCANWTNGSGSMPYAAVGNSGHTAGSWSDVFDQFCDRTNVRLYCFEQ